MRANTLAEQRGEQPVAGWWGKRMLFDFSGCDLAVIGDPDRQKLIIRRVVQHIGMQPHGLPDTTYFGELPDKRGWTVRQLLTTSNVEWHANDNGTVFGNLLSCKDFDEVAALLFLRLAFGATRWTSQVIYHYEPEGQQEL